MVGKLATETLRHGAGSWAAGRAYQGEFFLAASAFAPFDKPSDRLRASAEMKGASYSAKPTADMGYRKN